MYLQYASGVSITLLIPIFWLNFTFRRQSSSHSGRTPFRPPFLKVQFFKNMNAYASIAKNGLFIQTFFFFVRSNELKQQKMGFYGLIWIIRPPKNLLRLQKIAISCNLNQYTVESDLNEILHSFYIPMRPQASYFHTLLIIKKGGGKGCAHDTCKVVMGSKMWENGKKSNVFRLSIWVLPPFRPPFVQW